MSVMTGVHLTVDGGVYGVPNELKVPSSHVTWIRRDWLDKLGLEEPRRWMNSPT